MARQNMGDYNVDIVMCIDATGSMWPIIEEIKYNVLSFYEKFVEAMEDKRASVGQIRVKSIIFKDYACDEDPMVESDFYVLPEQVNEFRKFIADIEVFGGGDMPENALEAIALALKSNWTIEGAKRRHMIVVFSDASALPLGERKDCPNYPPNLPNSLEQLGAWWEGTDQTLSSTYQPKAGRLIAFVPNAEPWTLMQAWDRYWPAFISAGTGLREVDIQSVIDLLVGSF